MHVERQRAAQRLVQVGLFAHAVDGAGAAARPPGTAEFNEPQLQELHVGRSRGQLQRIEAGGLARLERKVLAVERPHQDLEAAILVEQHLGDALARQHGDQESDEHGLARTGRTADQGVARVLPAAAIRIGRIAGMQRKIVRRAGAGDEKRQCIAPMIAERTAGRKIVERPHGRQVARGDW